VIFEVNRTGRLNFKLEAVAQGSSARAARFQTLHNEVCTPVFMPVGTQATVKSQNLETLTEIGSPVLLANTYHLLLRPGKEVFDRMGGIHPFMGWKKSVLTDSGGFQIFSLPHSRDVSDEGALFRSYVDGQLILLSPEVSIGMQKAIGSDIMMVLDQCVPSTVDYSVALEAMNRTHLWAQRSKDTRGDSSQALFAIVQGACYSDLRRQSADFLTQKEFDGFAIGGLAVGESKALREDFTGLSAELLPENRPRYLMGVGTPLDILEAVHRGVDLFDCILPTALAQRGVAFTSQGKMQLRRGVYKFSEDSLDPGCYCKVCKTYSRAYLHHLVKAEEPLGWSLLGFHNLTFYQNLMTDIRQHILANTFLSYYQTQRGVLQQSDPEFPSKPTRRRKSRKSIPTNLGDYEVHRSPMGFYAIRQISSGEIMHSVNQPELEAERLYIQQSRFVDRIQIHSGLAPEVSEQVLPWIVWDVGLGAATNAMSVIRNYEQVGQGVIEQRETSSFRTRCETPSQHSLTPDFSPGVIGKRLRPVHLVSFEKDLDSLRLALKHPSLFPYLRHSAPYRLIEQGCWESQDLPLRWTLIFGDFLQEFQKMSAPNLIFYDPFSYKTDSLFWSWEFFQKLYLHCSSQATELFTYSASTQVRAGLMGAGFIVAKGVGTGPKKESTVAFTPWVQDATYPRLSEEWIDRWRKSSAPFPFGMEDAEKADFQKKLIEQFGSSCGAN